MHESEETMTDINWTMVAADTVCIAIGALLIYFAKDRKSWFEKFVMINIGIVFIRIMVLLNNGGA